MSRAAALEAVAKQVEDSPGWTRGAVADLSRRITEALGFK